MTLKSSVWLVAALLLASLAQPVIAQSTNSSGAGAPPTNTIPAGSIEVSFQFVEIREDLYQANSDKIDAAVKKGDGAFFQELRKKGALLLSIPSVTTLPEQPATIPILRKFRCPYAKDKADQVFVDENNAMIPDPGAPTARGVMILESHMQVASKNVGVVAKFKPSLDHGKIVLNGKLSVTGIKNFTRNDQGVFMAAFITNETPFLESLKDQQTKAIWVPGAHFDLENSGDLGVNSTWLIKERMILFLTASLTK